MAKVKNVERKMCNKKCVEGEFEYTHALCALFLKKLSFPPLALFPCSLPVFFEKTRKSMSAIP